MTAKTFMDGTHRARHPDHTWDLISPKLARFGITRVADVTGLDVIGIPVVMAVRPLSRTLSVSQGKGQSLTPARVSAVMESIELWHAETVLPPITHRAAPAAALDLPYELDGLRREPGSLVTEATILDWTDAVGLISGRRTPVPSDLIAFATPQRRGWTPPGIHATSNGLASGNDYDEAVLHALYEVIERDAVSLSPRAGRRAFVDPDSIGDDACAAMIDRIRAAGVELRLVHAPSVTGVPCFTAELWSPDFPVVTLGAGAHLAPEVALSRALTEAAQSRLTAIAGSRDDQAPVYDHVSAGADGRPEPAPAPLPWARLSARPVGDFTDLSEELAWVAAAAAAGFGGEPLVVDLSTDADFAVVKVIVPGAALDAGRMHPDGGPEFPPEEP
ncbi:YcaO-like family protein [Nonomuraea sp. NPDC005650]|uniref:YcaO-like family protein n=1 Tax=Nonomuraea sp. NPDC005650 TaxID=3157045 RepID=UPI0033A82F9E